VDGTAGTASAIAAGLYHSCAIQAGTGAVVCWGLNSYGGGDTASVRGRNPGQCHGNRGGWGRDWSRRR
jgi:alpha-tubulin suppressor-like RCC1 family protein